jgi:hypothetical protein
MLISRRSMNGVVSENFAMRYSEPALRKAFVAGDPCPPNRTFVIVMFGIRVGPTTSQLYGPLARSRV